MTNELTPLQKAVIAIKELRGRLDQLEQAQHEPIAVIGMACRFPGRSNTPEQFWELLANGRSAIIPIPPVRWDVDALYDPNPDAPGKMYVKEGGYLTDLEQFDPTLFNISPREADSLDPQHRLLLMTTWEALERAGQAPDQLQKSQTGVFVGIGQMDYAQQRVFSGNYSQIDTYDGTGNGFSFAAGRLAYTLGLQGPTFALDTACSSSLVAVHLACQSLRTQECQQAIAAGVHLSLSPEVSIFLSRSHALSPDGRCKTFSAEADGFGRGEGCGVLILKRLSDAVRDRDPILALLRGSAVNHDGPSSGLTVPNSQAQEQLIRQALAHAQLTPAEVSYLEAHGTGTSLGDPLEVEALAGVFKSSHTAENPLYLGAVKTNVGHCEAAAGMASLFKVILALQAEQIPPHLHFSTPNPRVDWSQLPFVVTQQAVAWPRGAKPRTAGVSAFGISGTNAHVVVQEAPTSPEITPLTRPVHLLTLSAKSEKGVRQLAQNYAHFVQQHPHLSPADLCATANTGRAQHPWRATVVVENLAQLPAQLSNLTPQQAKTPPKIAFLFTGQGSQYPGMGQELYQHAPLFREIVDYCLTLTPPHLTTQLSSFFTQHSLRQVTADTTLSTQHSALNTALVQPALFIFEYALAKLWQSWGVEPTALLGHSVGEITAACLAGVFSLEDALKLVVARGALMGALPAGGQMAAVMTDSATLTPFLQPYLAEVNIAAVNSPTNVVISGAGPAVEAIVAELTAQNIKTTFLDVSHAFHSPLMEPMLAEFQKVADTIHYAPPRLRLIANLTGELAPAEVATPSYWVRQVRQAVQFAAGAHTLHQLGIETFIEIGPKPTLLGLVNASLSSLILHPSSLFLPSLRPNQPTWPTLLSSLGELWKQGVAVNWSVLHPAGSFTKTILPTYPFDLGRYWVDKPTPPPTHQLPSLLSALAQGQQTEVLQQLQTHFPAGQEPFLAEILRLLTHHEPPATAVYDLVWSAQAVTNRPLNWQKVLVCSNQTHWLEQLPALLPAQTVFTDPTAAINWADVLDQTGPVEQLLLVWTAPINQADITLAEQMAQNWLALVQCLLTRPDSPHLWLVTQTAAGAHPHQLFYAPLWGLAKVLPLEQPHLWGGLVDLAAGATPADLVQQLASPETITSQHAHQTFVPRLTPSPAPPPPLAISNSGCYLITGGLGALGLQMAQWLIDQGARQLVLTGRKGMTNPEQEQTIQKWKWQGIQVMVAKVDTGDWPQMEKLIQAIHLSCGELHGIIHTAGVLGYEPLATLRPEELNQVLHPKLRGAWYLHQLTLDQPLDFFICFSSIASVWGGKGQAHYAAANQFLDALMLYRQTQGLPGLSLNWGPWAGGGMASAEGQSHLQRLGLTPFTPEQGVALFAKWAAAQGQKVLVQVDWAQFAPLLAHTPQAHWLEAVAPAVSAPAAAPLVSLWEKLSQLPGREREEALLNQVQEVAGRILGLRHTPADPDQGFAEMGMDSLMSVELKNQLQQMLGVTLSTTIAFDYPTITRLTAYLLALLEPAAAPVMELEPAEADFDDELDEDIEAKLARLQSLLD